MVNIVVPEDNELVTGTPGNDMITFDESGAAAFVGGKDHDGGGGSDTATLLLGDEDIVDFFTAVGGASATYVAETSPGAGDDIWTFGAGGNAVTLNNGFQSASFGGIALEATVASSGAVGATAAPDALGTYTADLTDIYTYEWTGTALTVEQFDGTFDIVSVDGTDIDGVTSFLSSDSAGAFTVNEAGSEIIFTPNTAQLAGDNNVGDVVTFSYDIVIADAAGVETTLTQTFDVTIGWTAGDDVAEGTAGADIITDGGDAGDTLEVPVTSSAGDDFISGGDGADDLTGGNGNDTVKGGNDGDTITDTSTDAADTNFLGGGAGDDTITASDSGDILIGAGGADSLTGGDGDDTIQGGGGNDVIDTGDGKNLVRGGDGDDDITGGNGADELRGGDGNDTVDGGEGNDVLFTSLGANDVLTGGLGDDSFIIKAGTGNTVITDFGVGNDELDVSELGYTTLADVLEVAYEVSDAGTSTVVIQIDAETSVTLDNIALSELGLVDFEFA